MANHTELPIYKVAYELLLLVTNLAKNMPRDFKASIGGELRDMAVQLIVLILRANCAKDKVPYLDRLLERVQVLELLLRLSTDMKFVSIGQYAAAIKITGQVGKQANGWRKHSASSPVA